MPHFRVFLGPPSIAELHKNPTDYHWQTVSSTSNTTTIHREDKEPYLPDYVLPPATLEAASARISLIYKNVIFGDDDSDADDDDQGVEEEAGQRAGGNLSQDESTMISWPPTDPRQPGETTSRSAADTSANNLTSVSRLHSMYETQDTGSFNYSDASSIACFPTFQIKLHVLTSLGSLLALSKHGQRGTRQISTLVAVLEIEGPEYIIIKKGIDAGKEVALLKFVVGDETGGICKLTAWRETAERWGGRTRDVAVLRGDVVSIENILATYEPSKTPTLTASPNMRSELVICYRTMPHTREDRRLRPDLRLGESDAAVRKVSATVRWFQGLAGL